MTTYTESIIETALCIWEYKLENEITSESGQSANRLSCIYEAEQIELGIAQATDDPQWDESFDWDYIPRVMGLFIDTDGDLKTIAGEEYLRQLTD